MTEEALKRANEIKKETALIGENLEKIEKVTNINGKWDENTIIVLSDGDRYRANLYDDILPISTKDIVTLYKSKAKARIDELQKELDSL